MSEPVVHFTKTWLPSDREHMDFIRIVLDHALGMNKISRSNYQEVLYAIYEAIQLYRE